MSKNSLDTLFLPLVQGDVEQRGKAMYMGGRPHPHLALFDNIYVYQPFKPWADEFNSCGFSAHKDMPQGHDFDTCLIQVPKQKVEAQFWFSQALDKLKEDGIILAAAPNDAGGARIETWMNELGLKTCSLSKHKARAVWARVSKSTCSEMLNFWRDAGGFRDQNIGEGLTFKTIPGAFSWDRIDKGSALLSAHLPQNIGGVVGDFGAGIGYLSHKILSRFSQISEIHIVEADWRALECSRYNLQGIKTKAEKGFHWHDLSKPLESLPPLDAVIMNPPFHQGSTHTIDIGQSFVKNAAHHLKKGGMLYMVSNTHLPYEDVLNQSFSSSKIILQKDGFKIIEARK